jgi:hypothetical protein
MCIFDTKRVHHPSVNLTFEPTMMAILKRLTILTAGILLLATCCEGRSFSCLTKQTRSTRKYNAIQIRGGASAKQQVPVSKQPVITTEGASVPNEVFNLVKGIVGVGVLSLPAGLLLCDFQVFYPRSGYSNRWFLITTGVAAFGNAPSAIIPAISLIGIIGVLSGYGFALIGKTCAYTGATSCE